jgi:hypothetical protein
MSAPVRWVTPPSKGTPTTATSIPAAVSLIGLRKKLATPA